MLQQNKCRTKLIIPGNLLSPFSVILLSVQKERPHNSNAHSNLRCYCKQRLSGYIYLHPQSNATIWFNKGECQVLNPRLHWQSKLCYSHHQAKVSNDSNAIVLDIIDLHKHRHNFFSCLMARTVAVVMVLQKYAKNKCHCQHRSPSCKFRYIY